MKLISMSVWGPEKYQVGALANAHAIPQVYPGWTLRVYVDGNTPTDDLVKAGAQVVVMPAPVTEVQGMFWRFLAISDPEAEVISIRDADSLVNVREAAAVNEWLGTDYQAMAMRDHPHHQGWAIFGGMWGIRGGVVPDVATLIANWGRWERRPDDMRFLREIILPKIEHSLLLYGEGIGSWRPYPPHPPFNGFVGQRVCE